MRYRIGGLGEVQTTFAPFGPPSQKLPPKPRVTRTEAVSTALSKTSALSVSAARAAAPSTGLSRPRPSGTPAPAAAPSVIAAPRAAAAVVAPRAADLAPSSPPETMPTNASGGGAYYRPSPQQEAEAAAADPLEPELQQTPVSASVDVPPELWIGLGILGAATILGGVWIATRPKSSGGAKKRRAFSAAP